MLMMKLPLRGPGATTPPGSPQRPVQKGMPRVMYPRDFGRVSEKDQSRRQAVLEYAAFASMSCFDHSPVCIDWAA